MSGSNPTQDIFDVRRIRRLVELMKEHDLNEIDLRQGDTRVVLRRGGDAVPARPAPPRRLPRSGRACRRAGRGCTGSTTSTSC